jgi:general secretion pathway protein K
VTCGARRWRRAQGGFALLTVLWVMVGASVLAVAASLAGRDAVDATRNRVSSARAYWHAYGCSERMRSIIDAALDTSDDAAAAWRLLDRATVVSTALRAGDCDVQLEAAGTRLDVNSASEEQLRALFRAIGRADVDSLADALIDWRDADDVARPSGAEGSWYVVARRTPPRNAPIADQREIAFVRGFERSAVFDSVLTVEPSRLSINSASADVLATVPGLSSELIDRVLEQRANGTPIGDLLALAERVSAQARREFLSHYPEVTRLTTVDPEAWLVRARGHDALANALETIELRLVRDGRRAAVLHRRSW